MEISQANISNSLVETKTKLTDDLFRLMQVRDKNKDMAKDWLLYLTTSKFCKLTPGEVYKAFQMAVSGDLRKENGEMIYFTHELSIIATGMVLDAYLKYKNDDAVYQLAKDKLKQLALPDISEPSDEQKKTIREGFLKVIYQEIKTDGYSHGAHLLFLELEKSGKLIISIEDKKKLYAEQLKIYIPNEQEDIKSKRSLSTKHLLKEFRDKINSGKSIVQVVNKCRSISVCNYLKDFVSDFETFNKEIQ